MNAITKKLVFGICILASFQNALYAMDFDNENQDSPQTEENQSDSESNHEQISLLQDDNSINIDQLRKQNELLETEIQKLKAVNKSYALSEDIKAHNTSSLKKLDSYMFGKEASEELKKKHQVFDRVLGAFKVSEKPAEISYSTKCKNFLLGGIGGIGRELAGAGLGEVTDAYANKKSWKPWYPFIPKKWYRPGSNTRKGPNVQAGTWQDSLWSFLLPQNPCRPELDITDIKDFELRGIIENQMDKANFHENINRVVFVTESTCGDTGSKVWPFAAKLDKGTLTIGVDTTTWLQPETKVAVAHKLACTVAAHERGDWPRVRKLFLYKCLYGASLLTAFGGAAYLAAINSGNPDLIENKNIVGLATGIGSVIPGLFFTNTRQKKSLAKQEIIANNERAIDITESFDGVKEACELGYCYPATSSVKYTLIGGDWEIGHRVKEVLPVLKHDLKQFPENQALPAHELLEHCRKYAIKKEYGMKHHTIKAPLDK